MKWVRFLLFVFALSIPARASAQESDVLTGRVIGQDGKAVVGARVTVMSIETEISRSVITDGNGRYMVIFPDGGGRYVVRIAFIGMAEITQAVVRNAEEELLLTNFTMEQQAIQLAAIEVTGQRPPPGQGNSGEQSTALSQEMASRLPLPDLDPNTLALLAAGVVGTSLDSLSGRMGFSVAGMSDLLNQITLDGVNLGESGLGVPEEGVRATQITTSTFDASRGGFAGGQVSMTTARGNNRSAGSLTYRLDDDALQLRSAPTTNSFTRHNLGGSWGGPIVRNRLFYNASFQFSRNTNHRFALSADDPLAAQRSGVNVDSIGRFLNILDTSYGFPTTGQTGAYDQLNGDLRLQGRVDWNVLQGQGTSQTLSTRFNLNVNDQDSTRINSLDLAQHGGEQDRNNRMVATTLTSRFGTNWTNAFRLSYSENWNDQLPYIEMPEGQVRVTSDFEDGTRGTRTLTFGGNRNMPQEAYTRELSAQNDASFLLPVGGQLHRLKLGASIEKGRNVNRSTDNLFGAFTFNSLEDFEANRPDRYERSLTERETRTGTINTGLYFGDTWRVTQPLEITLGLRWDRTKFDQAVPYNPAVETAFGRRTDFTPVSTQFSPRVGFSYRLNGQGQAPRSLSGGIGLFAGRAPTNIFSAALRQTGLPDAERRLICIGEAVPVPDWDLFIGNPGAVPNTCADGGAGVPDALSSRAPTVTLIDPDQSMPSSVRFDLGYRTRLPFNLNGNFRYQFSRGFGLWGYTDINLDTSDSFMLGNEPRVFFGDMSAIVPGTGAVSLAGSRLNSEFGSVYDVLSDRASNTHQFTVQAGGLLPIKNSTFNLNYTLTFARDQASGSFGQATTASDPNVAEWAVSSNDRRHNVNLTLAYPISQSIELTAITRLSSGQPFTPMVNRDINGDGARNDRAFIFDPAATGDSAIANSMQRLLNEVPGDVRECLESQLGRIADRNSCRNPWTQSLDLRASIRPNLPTLGRRLTLSLDGRNVLTGLDQLFHGRDNMHGWGEGQRSDANLLEVRGFEPTTQSFIYEINEGFGQTNRGPNAFRNAFSLTISGRLAIGGQPGMNNRGFGTIAAPAFGDFGGGGRGGFGGLGGGDFGGRGGFGGGPGGGFAMADLLRGGAEGANVDSLLDASLRNPVVQVIALKDSLSLSDAQVRSLSLISDTLDAQLARRREALQPMLANLAAQTRGGAAGGGRGAINPEAMRQVQLEIQPLMSSAQREAREALGLAQRELSAEQWEKVPAAIRNTGQAQAGGRGGFNAVGLIDRMLANPLPVLLELKDTLNLSAEQVAQIEAVSNGLQEKLNARREELGRRFDNAQDGVQQGRIFQEIQPAVETTRKEVGEALKAVEKILTPDQWKQVPDRIRNPFQGQGPGRGGRGGGQ
jgi:hypothetical protein